MLCLTFQELCDSLFLMHHLISSSLLYILEQNL